MIFVMKKHHLDHLLATIDSNGTGPLHVFVQKTITEYIAKNRDSLLNISVEYNVGKGCLADIVVTYGNPLNPTVEIIEVFGSQIRIDKKIKKKYFRYHRYCHTFSAAIYGECNRLKAQEWMDKFKRVYHVFPEEIEVRTPAACSA